LSVLEVDDIHVFYGDAQALFGVSLSVNPGEIVTLIGSNGAGKTTSLRAISGIRPLARGTIRFEGTSLADVPASRRPSLGIALVPEGRELWPLMTVEENLELGAYIPRARQHRAESLEYVYGLFPQLAGRRQQIAGSMSGGEQQMCAIGRALMTRPSLLMFDEPSLGLAPILVQQVFEYVERLRGEGLTILLVEQNLKQALEIADRGYVIETGVITRHGRATELLADETIRAAYLGI
jgi:branched-chain amino acid transport system ATP-binding protein